MPDITSPTPPAIPGLFNRSVTLAANGTIVIPANHMIVGMVVFNSTANAVTGGVKVGTTSGATDVTVALAIGANAFALGAPLKQVFSQSAADPLHPGSGRLEQRQHHGDLRPGQSGLRAIARSPRPSAALQSKALWSYLWNHADPPLSPLWPPGSPDHRQGGAHHAGEGAGRSPRHPVPEGHAL